MAGLLKFRDAIKNFCSKFDRILFPLFKFIMAFIMYKAIISITGGANATVSGSTVVLLLALIGAFVPGELTYALGGVVALMNYLSLNKEIGISFLIIFFVMYCVYIRFFPKLSWLILYAPLFFMFKLHYVLPILAGMFAGPAGAIAIAFGAVFYYFSGCASDYLYELAITDDEESMLESYKYIFQSLKGNKEMIVTVAVFAVIVVITWLIYRLSVEYSWYAAIVIGSLFQIILMLMANVIEETAISVSEIIIGSVVAMISCIIIQFFKTVLDYSKTEITQFEDDEYFYYVKAIPKVQAAKPKKVRVIVNDDNVGGVSR